MFDALLKYLISVGYNLKKESSNNSYEKNGIIISFDSKEIVINDIIDNRRFYFNSDTPDNILVNFLTYLDNNKVVI